MSVLMSSSRASLTPSPLVWTSAVLAAGVLLHVDQLPLWVSGVTFVLIAWRLSANPRNVTLPNRLLRAMMAPVLVAETLGLIRTSPAATSSRHYRTGRCEPGWRYCSSQRLLRTFIR
jgi:hypothetical protein